MSTESIVNRSEFEEKLNEFLERRKESNRARWTRQRLQNAKDVLLRGETAKSNGEKVPNSYYYLIQKYELLRIGEEIHVIKRRNEKNQSFIYMVALEDYYEKLLEAHLQTSHGGRDKIMYYLKDKCEVLKEACVLFVSCCQVCNRKRVPPKRAVPPKRVDNYKPTCGFNIQGQVDIIDFLSSHDGEYKWLLKYQDLGTKFVHLRPLTTNNAANVAKELSTIFFTWGAPRILQSQNGSKFVEAVLKELISLWPQFETVQGCPEDLLKASLEKSNADVQNMLNTWMIDNNSTNWSRGCYEVQKMNEHIVSRNEFEEKFGEFRNNQTSNRSVWDRKHLESVIKLLKQFEAVNSTKSSSYYHYSKLYELLKIGSEYHVILRRKNENDALIYMLAVEDYYDKLLEAHIQTGHGGRDKMLYYLKSKYRISKASCEIFTTCCRTCNRKRVAPKKGVAIKPITSTEFNIRGQVDLIDLQSCSDGEYNWVMNYQDHGTKFLHLRPLKSQHAANVAEELSKIFFTWGAPQILQSDNGQEFVASVVNKLASIWPHSKIVHECPQHPQSQGSVERSNADVESMLRAWMIDHKSMNWSRGCYEVQWQKNTSKHIVTDKIPYEAVFGPAKSSFKSATLPEQNLNGIVKQEVLETALDEQHVCSINTESDVESNKKKRKKSNLPDPMEFLSLENATSNTQEQNTQSDMQQPDTQLDAQNSLSVGRCGIQDHMQACEDPSKEEEVHVTQVIIKCEPPEYDEADQMEHFVEEQSREQLMRKNLPVECETCGEIFTSVSGLSTHMRSHTGAKPFECDICNKKLTNDQAAKTHINDHMGENQRFKCPMCPRDFKRYNFLRNHVQNHTKYDLYRCRICKESFATKGILQSHMITHQEKNFFSCDVCKRPFMLLWQLNKHKKIHLAEKPYACDTCGKRFLTPYHLNIHVRYHTGEKPFECNICKKRFTVKRTFKKHKASHVERQCDVCKKVFSSENALRSHNNKFHSDKRTYQCDTCGNTYLGRAGIIGHLRLHTGENPFECDICKQKFRYKSTLKSHKKNHIEADKPPEDGMDYEQAVFETVHVKVENGYHSDHTSADGEDGMVTIPKTIFKTEVQDKEACDPLNFNKEAKVKKIKTEVEEAIN